MLDKLPILRIITASLGGIIILSGIFFSLVYHRTQQLPKLDFSPCQRLTASPQADCVAEISYAFMTDSHWTAIIFCTLALTATLLGYMVARKQDALVISVFTGLICSISILNMVDSGGRLIAISILFGYALGGLMVHHKQHSNQ